MYKLRIEDLLYLEKELSLDIETMKAAKSVAEKRKRSYLISYPHFVRFFAEREKIDVQELVIGANFTYGWMPTVFVWKNDNFDSVLNLLNDVKNKNLILSTDEFLEIKSLINESIVGTSKILHFINPSIYPIWDSKINLLLSGDKKNTNTVDRYFEYYAIFQRLKMEKNSLEITKTISAKIGYEISFARAFEIILFLSSKATLEASKKIIIPKQTDKPLIPKYKRDEFIFISNLKKFNADPDYPITYKRDGYLLSEHYMTKSTRTLAQEVKQKRNLLISDNGNFTRIKQIAAKHNNEGLNVLRTASKEMIDHGAVSDATQKRRDELIDLIGEECKIATESLNIRKITKKQLSINPDYMIGMEDFAIPAMMLCNLMHPVFKPRAAQVLPYQNRTLSLYRAQEQGAYGNEELLKKTTNFLVLHAYDYASAYQAAVHSRDYPKDGIAISYGGPMLSNRWINSLELDGHMAVFKEKLPESYLIAQSLTLGIINGNPNPIPFHILGVGTPILIALIGYQLRHASAISIDSTAPFKDAFVGTLYGDKKAYIKMNMYRVAAFHLIAGTSFVSSTPFFKFFESKFPSDWNGLRDKFQVSPTMNYKQLARDLEGRPDLIETYIPFFSKMRGGGDDMMLNLRVCRSGHNFWILRRICQNIVKRRNDPPAFKQWIERQVERYTKVASYKWGKTVEKTYELTEKYRKF